MGLIVQGSVASPYRSAVKAVTWRVVAAIDTFVISYIITGSFAFAGSIVGIEAMSKMLFYYLHERAWAHISWGSGGATAITTADEPEVALAPVRIDEVA